MHTYTSIAMYGQRCYMDVKHWTLSSGMMKQRDAVDKVTKKLYTKQMSTENC